MPRKRKNILSDGRTAAKAKKREENRQYRETFLSRETAQETEARLADKRSRQSTSRSNETAQETEARVADMRSRQSTSRSTETPQETEARVADMRSRQSTSRSTETPQETEARVADMRSRQSTSRSTETPQETEARVADMRSRQSTSRSTETPQETEARVADMRSRQSTSRSTETAQETEARQATDLARHTLSIANENDEEKAKRLANDNQRKKQRRRSVPKSQFAARRSEDVFQATQLVDYGDVGSLFNEDGTPRWPNKICQHCHAIKWEKETMGFCCEAGKVNVTDPFEDTPEAIKDLWLNNNNESKLLKKFSRTINNALAIASLKVSYAPTPPGGNYRPSVIIQGKVAVKLGPVFANDGASPVFSQLYVLDSQFENETMLRIQNMVAMLPDRMTAEERNMLHHLIPKLQNIFHDCNPYVRDYKCAAEIIQQQHPQVVKLVIDAIRKPEGTHERTYNAPTGGHLNEVAIARKDGYDDASDFILTSRAPGNHSEAIRDTNRACDPLRFILFYVTGHDGWHLGMKMKNGKRLTSKSFYKFILQMRYDEGAIRFNPLHRGTRLFQEYACLAQAKIENQELFFYTTHQKQLRADKYGKLYEAVHAHDANDGELRAGKLIILPGSCTGSWRYMHCHFQDGMAILREFRKPDLFITFTCNQNWPEILGSLFPGQKAEDRPDLVARVFNQKLKQFMDDVIGNEIFGKVAAWLYVVEFQKRGLPHAHILLILTEESRMKNADDVDQLISAELPPDPLDFPAGPHRDQAEKLQQSVLNYMVHTCNEGCTKETGYCKRGFPKPFCESTRWEEKSMYPEYKRSKDGRVIEHENRQHQKRTVTNEWIVPYNAYLILKYDCHINCEGCISVNCCKYLFKYMHKGGDRLMLNAEVNEIENYQNLRYIGSPEAFWRIYSFGITGRYPAVIALRIHLEEEQTVIFEENDVEEALANAAKPTELMGFFQYNSEHPETSVRYCDFPKKFVWEKKRGKWKPRKPVQGREVIGRVHTVHPMAGDDFYLRLLLHHDHCKGKKSFKELRSYDSIDCDTYKEVCQKIGLLDHDGEWDQVLSEADKTRLCHQIRSLFVIILLYCQPSDPNMLFEKHKLEWLHDIRSRFPTSSDEMLTTLVLLDLEKKLQEKFKELSDFNLPLPTVQERTEASILLQENQEQKQSVIMQEELNYDYDETLMELEENLPKLTISQRAVYDEVMSALINGRALALFIDARGGTGKTFVLRTILHAIRTYDNKKNIALAVASSGIAATLLPNGRTFHSRLRAPLNSENENLTFSIKANDTTAKVVELALALAWDEMPMMHRHYGEGLDRTFRDITRIDELFGGKIIIVAGDFRQVLPVIPRASRAQITDASFRKSFLWPHFKVLSLTENMRVGNDPELKEFDDYLRNMGDGLLPIVGEPDWIDLSSQQILEFDGSNLASVRNAIEQFAEIIFPKLHQQVQLEKEIWIPWIAERAILAPRNKEVDEINQIICGNFPGSATEVYSADRTVNIEDSLRFQTEFLITLTPSGIPPHRLYLKEGIVLMLLRNLNPREGLCNGTRLILEHITPFLLHCRIASQKETQRKQVFIPRIDLTTDDTQSPVQWKRRQFPVRPAFAMTINKSQGQTLSKVGVWLEEPCFSHGQLYVASSRVGNPLNLHYAIKETDNKLTRNVVFPEALL